MFEYSAILYDTCIAQAERFTTGKNWIPKLGFFIFIYILFVAFPSFDLINKDFANGWNILLQQGAHPLTPQFFAPESHEAKMAFRLFIPLLIHFLHLNAWSILILQFVAGWLSWIIFIRIVEQYSGDKILAVILGCALACINFSKTTLDVRGVFFDTFAFLFLLIPFLYPRAWITFFALSFSAWTDERGLIASGFLFLFFLFDARKNLLNLAAVILAWIAYGALRIYLAQTYQLHTPTEGTGFSVIIGQLNNWILGVFSGLEGFWLLPSLFLIYKMKESKWLQAILFSGAMLIVIAVSLAVTDISRSMNYLFISIPLTLSFLAGKENRNSLRKISVIILLVSFLFPVVSFSSVREVYWSYPLPLQLFRIFFM